MGLVTGTQCAISKFMAEPDPPPNTVVGMSSKTKPDRLSPRERLARGLKYSTVGPLDVTRGALGIGLHSAQSSAAWVGNRYRRGHAASQLGKDLAVAQEAIASELAAAQEVVANLPQALKQARRSKRRPRPLLLVTGGVVVLGVGAVAFSIIRRSTRPEPSPRPPSVEVSPKP
jgi:Cell wall synthesis protein CwsA